MKNCNRVRPRAAFSSLRSQFFTIQTDRIATDRNAINWLTIGFTQLFFIELVYVPPTNRRKKSNERTSE